RRRFRPPPRRPRTPPRVERRWSLVVLVLAGAMARPAAAQPPTEPTEEARAQAAEHFDRGIAFFNEERYDAALAELARAHELAPAPATLYNLARVHAALGHAVQAAESYARYLEEAGDAIGARRRREVTEALAEQRSRIGRLTVRSDVRGATVAVDGVDVATTPLTEPIALSAGSHTVEVRAPGHETVRRAVAIAGESDTSVTVHLREEVVPRGTLRVAASVPEVTIAVDGEAVGVTPLASTVPLRAGAHVVTATRAGYRTEERRVRIDEGAEAEVNFDMRRDPDPAPDEVGRLHLELPDAPYLVRVDGELMLGAELELPRGAHGIELEVTDRRPYEGTVRVPRGSAIVIVPPLAWTLEARRERLDAARQQRVVGLTLSVAGGGLTVAGLAVLIWNETEIASTDARLLEINEELENECRTMGFDRRCEMLQDEGEALTADQDTQNVLRGVSIAGTVLGAAMTALGLVVWLDAPSDADVDAAARARERTSLRIGPGGVSLSGTF
ncbi:MAG TPA: PEGA domain-containing protein, partial [Sandaracinaceae bacterium LLY-WYZ-13_1]|nr:PEGA domain-containing protein [Sandaracinaceae bacterium LLY-WYZ-13_1]